MSLIDSLRPECLQIGSKARDKTEVLHEITKLALKSGLLAPFSEKEVFNALQSRENIGSTGFGQGIAIPHCSLKNLTEFVVGLLIIPEGVDFASLDGQKTRAFFFIVGPENKRNQHIQILSAVSRLLKSPADSSRLIEAPDKETLKERFLSLVQYKDKEKKGKSLFQVFIQREDYFEDILQAFSAAVQGTISVIETNNAGYYLNTMPLFTSYWTEKNRGFNRIILAVVEKGLSNDIIRRINLIVDDIDRESGVLITVQDLVYTSGSLDF
ncbi:MAG TPA: PTS sugar transporter subunit IIA [Spirochaetales bacterium]|nr:PTS sugar transporter subunit IIA [Spirochaetales bacterium]